MTRSKRPLTAGRVQIEHLRLDYDLAVSRGDDEQRKHIRQFNAALAKKMGEWKADEAARKRLSPKGGDELEAAPLSSLVIAKYQEPTVSRLITKKRIGGTELRAIDEIERVYNCLCAKLLVRGSSWVRVDNSLPNDPQWFLQAYHDRYLPWSRSWSERKARHQDRTLEVVYDVLFSRQTGKAIDDTQRWPHGLAIEIFINGIRDYAAMAGWVEGNTARKWSEVARAVFPLHRMSRKPA